MIIVVVTQQKKTVAVGASLAVGAWRWGLDGLFERVGSAFRRVEARQSAKRLVTGLMSHLERRNCWTLAEAVGDKGPHRFQHLLSRAKWDDAQVRSQIRSYVSQGLDTDGLRVLVVDETGDIKKGSKTVAVQRQYSGTAGRVENCQVAVYLALASDAGHAAVDVRLYLPRSWADDAKRRAGAGVPEAVGFATKPELAVDMITAARDGQVPADFVAGDEAYGVNPGLRDTLEKQGMSYVLALPRPPR